MPDYDPKFWEVLVDPNIIDLLSSKNVLWSEEPEDHVVIEKSRKREKLKTEAIQQISIIIKTRLTKHQQHILDLYFYQNKTQQEIANILGISQQVVSKHLFGVMRKGKRVGGAIVKLKKICEKMGIDPQKWV
jgi:RNA polymerase sigma factor (sigma-70 family)